MLLGLVLHAGVFSGTLVVGPWRIHQSSEFIYWIVALIHFFRMQLFFLLSGFFSSLVIDKIGLKKFIQSRSLRIILPFILCIVIFMPLMMAAQYVDLNNGNHNFFIILFDFYINPLYVFINEWPVGGWFWHFWFLQFLIAYIFLYGIARHTIIRNPSNNRKIHKILDILSTHKGFWILIFVTYAINLFGPPRFVVPGVAYSLNSLIYFGLFFIFGSVVYYRKNFLEDASKKFLVYFILFIIATVIIIPLRAKVSFTSGSELFNQDWSLFKIKTLENENGQWSFPVIDNIYNYSNFFVFDQNWHLFSFLRAFTTWYGIFFFIFLFKRFGDKKNKLWAYVSKSSYWVYLIHFPVQHLLYIFILRDNIKSSILLFFLLLLMSAVISFFSYNIFIRSTFVGKLLNGKLHNSERFKYNIDQKYFQKVITILIISFASFYFIHLYEKNDNSKFLNLSLHKDISGLKKIINDNPGITKYSRRRDGRTALHLLSTKINKFSDNNPDVISDSIKLILNDGLSINSQDNFGNTPLHYAVRSSNSKAVEVLINNNANPNIVNIVNHSTPLHNAASIGNKSILKLLLDNGADPNIANDYGKKPFDYYLFFNKDIDGNIKQKLSYN